MKILVAGIVVILTLWSDAMRAQSTAHSSPADAGFIRSKIRPHFRLLSDGGAIEFVAIDSLDDAARNALRAYASAVSAEVARGNFDAPLFSEHGAPPNIQTLKEQKNAFTCQVEELSGGVRIRITSSDQETRQALHDFLRFEITAHKSGDSLAAPISAKRPHPGTELGYDSPPGPDPN